MLIGYFLLFIWILFSTFYIWRLSKLGTDGVNPYVYDSIPSVFTTLGVLGTFVGIYFGLRGFDVDRITESIPALLTGLKTAFTTSIAGVVLSLVFGKISQVVLRAVESDEPPKATDELAALQELITLTKDGQEITNGHFKALTTALVSDNNESLSTHLTKLRNVAHDNTKHLKDQSESLEKVRRLLGGNDETSLLTQMEKLRDEQRESLKEVSKAINGEDQSSLKSELHTLRETLSENVELDKKFRIDLVQTLAANSQLISRKFDEFSELLAKNNTEALVEVMKSATEEFNKQMTAIVEKLIQENFKELNNSVQQMNTWQQENKSMITQLTNQFEKVSEEFEISSAAITEITENTAKLTDDNSHLTKLIEALQEVMVDDTKFQNIINQLSSTIDTLEENTEAFDETTNKLNHWVRNQMNFSDSVAKLLIRLEEIDEIKDINEVFWNNTKKQLEEGVGIIARGSEALNADLENINAEFYNRLNDTLQNLDGLIQRIIEKHATV